MDNSTRDTLVPINKKWPLEKLLDSLKNFPKVNNSRRITFEYVMLKGINDSKADAKRLIELLKSFHSKLNLIPFNPWPGNKFESSDMETIEEFKDIICNQGSITVTIRLPRGDDISAACGQLKSNY